MLIICYRDSNLFRREFMLSCAKIILLMFLRRIFSEDLWGFVTTYLRLLFDLFVVTLVNSFRVYKKLENQDLTLKEFKICIELKLIASFVCRKLTCPHHRPSKRTKAQRPGPIPPSHLPIFLKTRWRCTVCAQARKENRTFVSCSLCDVAVFL